MTPYTDVYTRFLQHITDYDFVNMEEYDLEEMLYGWMLSAIVKFHRCAVDLSDRDEESMCFNNKLSNNEIEILALLMVVEWLEPQVNSVLLTKQFFGGKEEKFYSQSNHLDTMMTLRDNARITAKKLIRDESYVNNNYFN